LTNARRLVRRAHYFPLSDRAYKIAAERFTQGVTGTIFKGEARVGMRIEDLVKLIETH
jgi:hypothetical protein